MESNKGLIATNKAFGILAAATAGLLAVLFIASQVIDEMEWTASDFIIIAVLMMSIGSLVIVLARRFRSSRKQLVAVCVGILLFLWLWAELAVGIFTNWGS